MTIEEIDETIQILPQATKETMVRNYFRQQENPNSNEYFISVQGRKIVERLIELGDSSLLALRAANEPH